MIAGLPAIWIDNRACRLPLCEPTAGDLLSVMLEPGTAAAQAQSAAARLSEALTLDPSLALWAVWQYVSEVGPAVPAPSVADLAAWLSVNLGRLVCDASEPVSCQPCSAAFKPGELATLAADSVAAAVAATGKASPSDDARYLAALIAQALPVLASCGFSSELLSQHSPWLATALRAAPRKRKLSIPARGIGRRGPVTKTPAARYPAGSRASAARQRWLLPAGFAAKNFSAVAASLLRHQQLLAEFDERLEAEKLEAMAEFAAGAGHEINNPLAVISGRAQLFLRHEQDPERRRDLAIINTQARRVHEMIADLMLFARPPEPRCTDCDVTAVVDTVVSELAPRAAAAGVEISLQCASDLPAIQADVTQLQVALRAVCENALDALAGRATGARVEISCHVSAHFEPSPLAGEGRVGGAVSLRHLPSPRPSPIEGEGEVQSGVAEVAGSCASCVVLTVRDNGPGMLPEVRRHAFDPFYSGRGAGRGLGNGLSKCWRIVTGHGGTVEIDSTSAGTIVTLCLPCSDEAHIREH